MRTPRAIALLWVAATMLAACVPRPHPESAELIPDGGSPDGIPLGGCNATGYTVPVRVGAGSAAQSFTLSLDTGSSTTAIAASGCAGCSDVVPQFVSTATTEDEARSVSSAFGDLSVWSGECVSDLLEIADATQPVRTSFVAITNQSGFFQSLDCNGNPASSSPVQGVLAMGPPDLLLTGTQDFFSQLVAGSRASDIFTVELCPAGGGRLWLGSSDPESLAKPLQYTALVDPSGADRSGGMGSVFWEVHAQGFGMGAEPLNGGTDAILDTGTTVNLLPTSVYQDILGALRTSDAFVALFGQNGYADLFTRNQCDAPLNGESIDEINAALPRLRVSFPDVDGGVFTLDVPATGAYLSVLGSGASSKYCYGMLDASQGGVGGGGPGAILGAVFMSAFVTVFDLGNNRIGLAPQGRCD
jgi:hypothetical protein